MANACSDDNTPDDDEQRLILDALADALHREWVAIEAIQHLNTVSTNATQLEWQGFYFEERARSILRDTIGGDLGPRFGRTTFDYERTRVWDFKAHTAFSRSGSPKHQSILNDCEAVETCLLGRGGVGWVIAVGEATWDEDGSVRRFQQELQGGESAYTRQRRAEGRPSRVRKQSFRLKRLIAIEFGSPGELERALEQGWMDGNMQRGMRNSNGRPRRAKYRLHLQRWNDAGMPFGRQVVL